MVSNNSKAELSLREAEDLVSQLQVAHRLLVGFHSRFLPLLEFMAREINPALAFSYWKPLETLSPPNGSRPPTSRWAWDFFPLYAFNCVYVSCHGDSMEEEDRVVTFLIHTEDSFSKEKKRRSGEPDPISLPQGEGIFRAYVYKPEAKSRASLIDAYTRAQWVTSSDWEAAGEGMVGVCREWTLAEVIASPEAVIQAVKAYI